VNKPAIILSSILLTFFTSSSFSQNKKLKSEIDVLVNEIESSVIESRRYFHENPELSNREFKTAERIASQLRTIGLEPQTEIAKTGVVAILETGKPGPVIALRADIDGLPVVERTPVPFASKAKGIYNLAEVGVMHACGHDTHIAILLGVAEILVKRKESLKGKIKFIFQPAEEGAPFGEEGGAELMVKEGVLKNPDVEAIFGLHIAAGRPVGTISYRPGGIMASANSFSIRVFGKQTHGSTPWTGIDPIVTSALIINGLQTIVSRYSELTKEAAVVSLGSIHGGVRSNIIPEEVEMVGTIRALDEGMKQNLFNRIKHTASTIAESQGASVEVTIHHGVPITYNDPVLTSKVLPTLQQAAGKEKVLLMNAITGAEDFSYFLEKIPGFYFFLGGMPPDVTPEEAAPHHTPDFYIDESGLKLGVKTLSYLAVDYLLSND